ncbi:MULTISPECIES: hypothetical protein [unclassified Coleofasciculus]|uniref:hypothetical protein n=1 Tax=unclassified Coleofasciculus TaxID=2692782 RepID=UPI001880B4AA|nr:MULTISPECIES: hypothetical protein [unclassified Coleofasciculus]MBE9124820.1 hypothetical protein [Coleofasciculus sp. LEGE 07081]MBE9147725.1 hypothetical protein [Coleofasciculus sp. LEGE 07092]
MVPAIGNKGTVGNTVGNMVSVYTVLIPYPLCFLAHFHQSASNQSDLIAGTTTDT